MTGRTHDLAAFAAVSLAFVHSPPAGMTLATLITSLGAAFIGGLYPDLDNASSNFWAKIPGGSLIGRLLAPLLGGHRMISHSLLGFVLTGLILSRLLAGISGVFLVDMTIVWWAFIIGYASHLFIDSFTKEGIPLLFPIPVRLGFPPIRQLRLKTGGRSEKFLVYPGLMLLTGYVYMQNYRDIVFFFQQNLH